MQCSLSPPKSSSNWLDRLHASKGFSISTDLDLDRFLTSSSADPDPNPNPNPDPNPNPNPNPPSPRNATLPDPPTKRRRRRPRQAPAVNPPLFDLMTSVLAELFVMGGPPPPSQAIGTLGERSRKKKKKSSRKQANPKACPPSASASAAADGGAACGAAPSSADNSVAEEATKGSKKKRAAAEGPSKDSDLAGYRRTDVTVIDTSSPGWKSVKLIYRKGKEWKVRVKKYWSSCQKKKRKVGLVGDKGKEQSKLGSKALDRKEFSASLDQLRDQENVHAKDGDTLKVSDDRMQIPVKRPKFSRSPRLSAVKKSSLLRMQVVPVGKNSTPSSSKGPHKG